MTSAPISIAGLNHAFGRGDLRRQILFEVTTDIPAGEIVIVTGPSGSGKTTLLTLVGALRATQEGSLRVLGEELRGARPGALESVRRRIGFIFQQHNLVAALTALQNVELGLRIAGGARWRSSARVAGKMLEAVGLGGHLHVRPERMSGGQRQRVAIARALVGEPAILLADEPTASLDRQSGRDVVERMQALARELGTTIILVTHDNRILDVADRILHIEDGRLSTFGEAVIADTKHLMRTLAQQTQKHSVDEVVDALDQSQFVALLADIASEAQSFLDATSRAGDEAFQRMLEHSLRAFTRKLGSILNAERASLFLVDRARHELWLRVSEDVAEDIEGAVGVRIPLSTGIAGAVADSGELVRVDDAYSDARFNPAMDRRTGFRTRSILCVPVRNRDGEVFAVAQLLNRGDGLPFDANDETRFGEFIGSVAVILETLALLSLDRPV